MVREKEEFKVYADVFDRATLKTLYKLCGDGLFDYIQGVIATGKEANVHRAVKGSEYVALKIYKITKLGYREFLKYLRGDPRFPKLGGGLRKLIYAWAKKEYLNLLKAKEADVRAPIPYAQRNNVLVLEYIGVNEHPAPRAKEAPPSEPERWYRKVMRYVEQMYEVDFVHGDLNEYNILNQRGEPVLIDFSQGVPIEHPLAKEMLFRDICNLSRWFARLGVGVKEPAEVYEELTGERWSTL